MPTSFCKYLQAVFLAFFQYGPVWEIFMFCSNMQEAVLRNLIFSFLPEQLFILLFFHYLSTPPNCQSQVFSLENISASSTLEKQNKTTKQNNIPPPHKTSPNTDIKIQNNIGVIITLVYQ